MRGAPGGRGMRSVFKAMTRLGSLGGGSPGLSRAMRHWWPALLGVGMGMLVWPATGTSYPVSGLAIWTIAGTPRTACSAAPCGDGRAATSATLNTPSGVAVDGSGNVLIADG